MRKVGIYLLGVVQVLFLMVLALVLSLVGFVHGNTRRGILETGEEFWDDLKQFVEGRLR